MPALHSVPKVRSTRQAPQRTVRLEEMVWVGSRVGTIPILVHAAADNVVGY